MHCSAPKASVGLVAGLLGAVAVCSVCLSGTAFAETYRVGPGQKYARISKLTSRLRPGDVVEVSGDIADTFVLTSHGLPDRPITISGVTRVENGRILRPRITITGNTTVGIYCKGDFNVLEGLDITGAHGDSKLASTAIYSECRELVLRNCRIHHNGIAVYGSYTDSGNILIEFCEFDSNGGTYGGRSLYLNALAPGTTAIVQFCYFHDGTTGYMLKSCYPRNLIRYNWFESSFSSAITIISNEETNSPERRGKASDAWYPAHSDIVGNVFLQGWSPGPHWTLLSLGGEGELTEGTEGDFNIAHNLFVMTNNNGSAPALLVHGNVDHVRVYNNVFLSQGLSTFYVYSRGTIWGTSRTKSFIERRGTGEPTLVGSNNWISENAVGVPSQFLKSIRGTNPEFVDLLNGNYQPRKDSPVISAGISPLPRGQIPDLLPEYEPQRGIPSDLKPRPRKHVTPPTIGPFEMR